MRGRISVAVLIVGFWAIMTTLLLKREVLVPRLPAGARPATAVPSCPQDIWMGVFLSDGRRVGFIHAESLAEVRGGEPGVLAADVALANVAGAASRANHTPARKAPHKLPRNKTMTANT